MLPTIGLMMAAYIDIRLLEALVCMGKGGVHDSLSSGAKVFLVLAAVGALLVVVDGARGLLAAGSTQVPLGY